MRPKEETTLSDRQDAAAPRAAAAARTTSRARRNPTAGKALLSAVLASLEDDKAEDVVSIDLAGKSELADYMVVASGRSARQVVAIADHLLETLKADHGIIARSEGRGLGDWVLIDAGDVIVHIFRPEVREFYQLEKMWLTPAPKAAAGRG